MSGQGGENPTPLPSSAPEFPSSRLPIYNRMVRCKDLRERNFRGRVRKLSETPA
jgi:hypothetical protein